jgi:hypothetical protein
VVALAPLLSVTVAPVMTAAPTVLVTVPVTPCVVAEGVRLKLTFMVVFPEVTDAVCVWELKPGAVAVRVWLPGVSPDRVYAPEPSVVALAPPVSLTVAPDMAAPPAALSTDPLIDPGAGGTAVRLKLTLVVLPAVTEAVFVPALKPLADAPTEWVPGVSPGRL